MINKRLNGIPDNEFSNDMEYMKKRRKFSEYFCIICGAKFVSRCNSAKYCSHDCYLDAIFYSRTKRKRKRLQIVNCKYPNCGKRFMQLKSTQKYCRQQCSTADHNYNRRIEKKAWGVNYLGGKCVYCGYNKSHKALDFHHLNPKEKEDDLSRMFSLKGYDELKNELDKCVLVCANCHREMEESIHIERRGMKIKRTDIYKNIVPTNEFSEICTGDMESMDSMYHKWCQDDQREQKEECERNFRDGKGYRTLKIIHENGEVENRGETDLEKDS